MKCTHPLPTHTYREPTRVATNMAVVCTSENFHVISLALSAIINLKYMYSITGGIQNSKHYGVSPSISFISALSVVTFTPTGAKKNTTAAVGINITGDLPFVIILAWIKGGANKLPVTTFQFFLTWKRNADARCFRMWIGSKMLRNAWELNCLSYRRHFMKKFNFVFKACM